MATSPGYHRGAWLPPAAAALFDRPTAHVERWALAGPLPDSFGYEPQA